MSLRFLRNGWLLGDLVALGMIYLAWHEDHAILALPGVILLLRHVVAAVNAVTERRQRARVDAILDEAFEEYPEMRPKYTLRGTLGSPGFDLVFKTPEDIRRAEQDGRLQQVMERATSLYGMHVVLDVASR